MSGRTLQANSGDIVIDEGGKLSVETLRGLDAVYMEGNYSSLMSFKNAKIEAWNRLNDTSDEATEVYTGVTGQVAWNGYFTKSIQSNNSDFNKTWGGNGKTTNPYSKIVINGGKSDSGVLSANDIEYKKGDKVTESQFLSDTKATSTNTTNAIQSDFASVVDLNKVGKYNVTISQKNSTSITVTVTVTEDNKPPKLDVDLGAKGYVLYYTDEYNPIKSEEDFLKDIKAQTDSDATIMSNFNNSMLKEMQFNSVTLKAVNASGMTAEKKVKVVTVIRNQTIIGKDYVLKAESFTIKIADASALTKSNVKNKKHSNIIAFSLDDGENLKPDVTVNNVQLQAIKKSRIPAKNKLTFYLNKTEPLEIEVEVPTT